MSESLVFSRVKISLNPCFLTFWSTEVDPYSLFNFLIILVCLLFIFHSMLAAYKHKKVTGAYLMMMFVWFMIGIDQVFTKTLISSALMQK